MKFEHPLAAEFEAWAATGEPIVPFRSDAKEFLKAWKESDLSWIFQHAYARKQFAETYRRSRLLGAALTQSDCSADLHEMIYTAAAGSFLAFALCDACDIARSMGPDWFLKFSIAMRFEGFANALMDWALLMEYDRSFDAVVAMKPVVREMIPGKHPGASFWLHAVQEGFHDLEDFAVRFETERRRFKDAAKKKEERGTSRPSPQFKNAIMLGWVPFCFWAQTAGEILGMLEPGSMDGVGRIQRIGNDISALKIGGSHRSMLSKYLTAEFKKIAGRNPRQ